MERPLLNLKTNSNAGCHQLCAVCVSNYRSLKTDIFKNLQYFQVKVSLNRNLSANNLLKFLHPIHQQRSLISVQFRGLICRKIRNVCFPTTGTAPKRRTFVVIFLNRKILLKQTVHNSRKRQVQYLTLVGNSRSSLRRPLFSLFIRASLANQLFRCSCPIGFLGNLSITAKWRSAHLFFF